ncbi:MAG: Hsp70 family protein [Treponema sp.]|nr:Hsp70 family protein [Treponema sp.]
MAGTIGIKVANGNFYPIVGENYTVRKKLVLTTVHDNQDSVQIDLFRSISKSMLDAQYIGSLVVEDIRPALKGEPSIEMIISAEEDGNITAEAYDQDASPDSDHHVLNVSLRTMDTFTKPDDYPDFEMDNDIPQSVSGSFERERERREKDRKRKFPWGVLAVAAVLIIIGIMAVWLFLLRDDGGFPIARPGAEHPMAEAPAEVPPPVAVTPPPPPPAPPPVAAATPPVDTPPPATPPAAAATPPVDTPAPPPAVQPPPAAPPPPPVAVSPPVIQAPVVPPPAAPQVVQGQRPPAPVLTHRVPAVIPPNGVVYQIRWGDTLWDISAAFYRDPLLYPRIARFNNIRNPNLILAGFNVRIPPLD